MSDIELIEVSNAYTDDIWEFRKGIIECDAGNEDQFAGYSGLGESGSLEAWVRICRPRRSEETCYEAGTKVPSHIYMAVRKEDNKVVGITDLRHYTNHPILGSWGGHCGYSVRPSERGKGYMEEMLRLNKRNAKALGITRLLVTCDKKNIVSEKTITSNGGVYEQTIEADGTKMKRYWVTI